MPPDTLGSGEVRGADALSRARWERASRDGEGWEEQPNTRSVALQSQGEQKPWEIPRKGVFKCSFPCARICASW